MIGPTGGAGRFIGRFASSLSCGLIAFIRPPNLPLAAQLVALLDDAVSLISKDRSLRPKGG
jgi:hypothetical protein